MPLPLSFSLLLRLTSNLVASCMPPPLSLFFCLIHSLLLPLPTSLHPALIPACLILLFLPSYSSCLSLLPSFIPASPTPSYSIYLVLRLPCPTPLTLPTYSLTTSSMLALLSSFLLLTASKSLLLPFPPASLSHSCFPLHLLACFPSLLLAFLPLA